MSPQHRARACHCPRGMQLRERVMSHHEGQVHGSFMVVRSHSACQRSGRMAMHFASFVEAMKVALCGDRVLTTKGAGMYWEPLHCPKHCPKR